VPPPVVGPGLRPAPHPSMLTSAAAILGRVVEDQHAPGAVAAAHQRRVAVLQQPGRRLGDRRHELHRGLGHRHRAAHQSSALPHQPGMRRTRGEHAVHRPHHPIPRRPARGPLLGTRPERRPQPPGLASAAVPSSEPSTVRGRAAPPHPTASLLRSQATRSATVPAGPPAPRRASARC
jgi:hypothetical protein